MDHDAINAAAGYFAAACTGAPGRAAPPPAPDADSATAIQLATIDRIGGLGGWKHALLGGRTLACAPIPRPALLTSGARLTLAPAMRVEVELAVVLGRRLDPRASRDELAASIDGIRICFEFLHSRLPATRPAGPFDAMADRFSNRNVVLGDPLADWRRCDIATLRPELTMPGCASPLPSAAGMDLDEIADFLAFLAEHAARHDRVVEAGQVIITGARIGPCAVTGPGTLAARCGVARVACTLVAA